MTILFWDSSALAKRFAPEISSSSVNQIFAYAGANSLPMVALSSVYAETFSLLVRKRNRGDITPLFFTNAVATLRRELQVNSAFTVIPLNDAAVYASLPLIDRQSLNASDALILVQYSLYLSGRPNNTGVLIASDARLLRAAQEGLGTLDPEKIPAADLTAFLASL